MGSAGGGVWRWARGIALYNRKHQLVVGSRVCVWVKQQKIARNNGRMKKSNGWKMDDGYGTEDREMTNASSPRTSQGKRLSKVSTQSHLSSHMSTRRLSDARSTGRLHSPFPSPSSHQPPPPTIFHTLSTLLQSQPKILSQYKQKLQTAKHKVTTTFQHLKDDLRLMLENQQFLICQQLNEKYKQFISIFEGTKNEVHRLYDQKAKFFQQHESAFQVPTTKQFQNGVMKNKQILNEMREQNERAIYARKYQAFFAIFQQKFEMLAERKKEIDRKLAEEIFDYSGNVGRLKELKEGFRRAVEGVFMGEEGAREEREEREEESVVEQEFGRGGYCVMTPVRRYRIEEGFL